jgi:hypothetical protein
MLKTLRPIVLICAPWLPSLAYAACPYPAEVDVSVEGATASAAEMSAMENRIRLYMAEMQAYTKCLDDESQALGRPETPEERQLHNQRHNAAVDAMEAAAAHYNEQVRAYNLKNP